MSIDAIARGLAAAALAASGGGGVSLSGNNTWTGANAFNAGITLGGSISAASWGLTGIKLIGGGSTLTDTSGAGTVASGATDVLGGNTIAATNARTITDYYSLYIKNPIAGTNVTLTNKWSLGLEGGLKVGGAIVGPSSAGFSISSSPTSQQLVLSGGNGSLTLSSFVAFFNNLSIDLNNSNLTKVASISFGSANDAILVRDAANTLALRNGTNAQTLNIYNSYTDASNYSRITSYFSGSIAYFHPEGAGTGAASITSLVLAARNGAAGTLYLRPDRAASTGWTISSSGLLAETDNSYDIGASGANRPRNLYVAGLGNFGGAITSNSTINAGAGSFLGWTGRSQIFSGADGYVDFYNNAISGFTALRFGGTTSSFPALKRSSAALQARLADDSAFAFIQGKHQTDTAYTATPPTCTGYLTMYDSTGTAYKVMVST